MKIASLAMSLGFIGLCLPAQAGLIGATVDGRRYYPDLTPAGLELDGGSTTVSGAVEYANLFSFSVDVTDTQIRITSLAAGNLNFTGGVVFNGFEFLFSGVTITGATVDGSSNFNPVITVVGNNVFLDYQGDNTGTALATSIIDITTSTSGVPEPGTLTLLGAGLAGLGFRYRRRSV